MHANKGLLLIDKPSGMTSHDVIAIVRKKLGIKKVGHAGTLDPLATGLLIVLVGREYTKRQAEFMEGEKEYVVKAKLGVVTDTYDIEGRVLSQVPQFQISNVKCQNLKSKLKNYLGKIEQKVPAFSAVKIKGKKLYELARKDKIDIESLPVRQIEIKVIELESYKVIEESQEVFFTLRVVCSKGTYIRSLIHDIGQDLGVGATVVELRRVRSGDFSIESAASIEEILISKLKSQL